MTVTNPKKLKGAQVEKLRKIALDGRRRLVDRRWAASQLSEHGVEVGPNVIRGYATPGEGSQALLKAEGGCITVQEARTLFRMPSLVEEIRKRNVIVFPAGLDGRLSRLMSWGRLVPVWQFKPDGGVLNGLPAAFKMLRKAIGADSYSPFCFFLQPEPMLGLRTPLEALRRGETQQVLEAAIAHVQFFGSSAKLRDLLLARGEADRPLIEKRSGRSFSTVEVAARFGVTAGTVRSWVATNRCVGYLGIGRRLRLPAWQFSGRKSICPWVAPLIKAYDVNGWALLDFVTVPRSRIADIPVDNESLLHRVQAGDVDLVLAAARRANLD